MSGVVVVVVVAVVIVSEGVGKFSYVITHAKDFYPLQCRVCLGYELHNSFAVAKWFCVLGYDVCLCVMKSCLSSHHHHRNNNCSQHGISFFFLHAKVRLLKSSTTTILTTTIELDVWCDFFT